MVWHNVVSMRRLLVVTMLLALSACSEETAPPRPRADATPTVAPSDSPPRPEKPAPYDPGAVDLELVGYVDGLESPLLLTHAGDGSGRTFVVEQPGRIRVVKDGELLPEPFLDIADRIVSGGEQGLLGLAFHPDYERNGRFFVNYTDTAGDTVVSQFRAKPSSDTAFGSELVLLKIEQPYANHNGGHLAFGPDGYLYIGTGDGGSGGDPHDSGQRLDTLLGKLLRIDVDRGSSYSIPDDNPFAEEGGEPEIWAYGLRNPWRFTFDSQHIWIADVGQNAIEEVNRRRADEAGVNYGWKVMEGTDCFEGDCERKGLVGPIAEYSHEDGCSITGGFVYRGGRFPDMQGGYFFGDFCSGTVWSVPAEVSSRTRPVEMLSTDLSISSFGVDENDALYVVDMAGGRVLELTDRD